MTDPDDLVDDVGCVFPASRWVDTAPGTNTAVVSLRDDGDAPLAVRLRPIHWGSAAVRPATVVASSAWNGFQYLTASPADSCRLLVLPGASRFDAAAPAVRTAGLIGANRSPRLGSGSEFASIRPFAPGDRLRRIHWVESLRSGTLHVTSTWSDDDRHVVLLIDAFDDVGQSDGIDGRASSLDISVRAAAAIAEHYCTSGDRVTVVTMGATGFRRLAPSAGHGHLRRLLEVLARVQPAHVVVDDGRLPRGLGRDALVLLFSPLVSQSALRRLARLADRGLAVAGIDCLPPEIVDEDPTRPGSERCVAARGSRARAALAPRPRIGHRRRCVGWTRELGSRIARAAASHPQSDGDTVNLLHHISVTQVLLRAAVVVAVLAALGCTRATGSPLPFLELTIAVLAPFCAWSPATHFGGLVTVLIGIHWLLAVDDADTAWVIGAGVSIALMHMAAAAASVGPLAAEWTPAMRTRWGRRLGLLAASTLPAWLLVGLAGRARIGSSSLLVTAALLSVSSALLWVSGNLRPNSER